MPYILEAFGSTPIPQYNGRHDLSTASSPARGVSLATGGEVDLYGDDPAPPEAMTLRLSGWLVGTNYAEDFKALRARARMKDVLWRLWDDGTREWTPARLLQVPTERTGRGIRGIEPSLIFWLPLPVWYDETPIDMLAEDLYDEDGSDLPTTGAEGAALGSPLELLVTNNGNLHAMRIILKITSGTGTVTAATFTNETTGHELEWAGSLTAGQELVINAGNERITRNNVAAYSELTALDDKQYWFLLQPGDNHITVEFTDSATDDSTVVGLYAEHTSA